MYYVSLFGVVIIMMVRNHSTESDELCMRPPNISGGEQRRYEFAWHINKNTSIMASSLPSNNFIEIVGLAFRICFSPHNKCRTCIECEFANSWDNPIWYSCVCGRFQCINHQRKLWKKKRKHQKRRLKKSNSHTLNWHNNLPRKFSHLNKLW